MRNFFSLFPCGFIIYIYVYYYQTIFVNVASNVHKAVSYYNERAWKDIPLFTRKARFQIIHQIKFSIPN